MPSPCLTCDFKDDDKNNERCANCEKRIKYARNEFMIPTEALEADLAAREETRKILELRTGKPGKKRGPKPKVRKEAVSMEAGDAQVKKRGWPKGRKRGPRVKAVEEKVVIGRPRQPTGRYHDRWNLRIAPKKTDTRVIDILEELWKIARIEFRKPNEQGLVFIKEGIDKWKEEHKGGIGNG